MPKSQTIRILLIALIVAFGIIERRQAEPMLPLSIFRIPTMTASLLASLFQGLASFAVLFLVLMYLQGPRGLSPIHASLLLLLASAPRCSSSSLRISEGRSSPEPGKHSNAFREVKQHQQDRLRRPMRTAGWGGRGTLDRGFVAGTIRRAFARQRKPHDEPWSCGTNPRIRARSTVVHASCRPHWAPIQPSITCQSGTD